MANRVKFMGSHIVKENVCGERGGILLCLHGVRLCAEKEMIFFFFFQMTGRCQRASHFISQRWLRLLITDNTNGVILLDRTQNTNLQKNLWERFPSDGVFCIFVVFWVVLLARRQHKCANTQMRK
jgi:hypothetical protein